MATPKKVIPPAPKAPAARYPKVDIIERRIQSGAANMGRAVAFELKGQPEPMIIRSFNCGISGRFFEATERLGWTPIEPGEVKGGLARGGEVRAHDGQVVSGDHGEDIWMKMPKRLFTQVAASKAEKINREFRSKAKLLGRTRAALEGDAKTADKAGAEGLERAAEGLAGLEIDQLNVSIERHAVDAPPME